MEGRILVILSPEKPENYPAASFGQALTVKSVRIKGCAVRIQQGKAVSRTQPKKEVLGISDLKKFWGGSVVIT